MNFRIAVHKDEECVAKKNFEGCPVKNMKTIFEHLKTFIEFNNPGCRTEIVVTLNESKDKL